MATITKSLTVANKSGYILTINAIPTGSTVTPVNDIQTWLHCADIWDKAYTTIDQVLADASTLQALIASNNAVDYMARSTSWASSVTANSNAMTYIGANNYCANKLLANSTWLNAICNSTYFESVLNVKVPTMTSNTTPYGEAIGYPAHATGPFYYAFTQNPNTRYLGADSNLAQYVGYKFTNPVCVKRYTVSHTSQFSGVTFEAKLQASNDGTNWVDLDNYSVVVVNAGALASVDRNVNNNNYYLYYRVLRTGMSASDYFYTALLQFYGRA